MKMPFCLLSYNESQVLVLHEKCAAIQTSGAYVLRGNSYMMVIKKVKSSPFKSCLFNCFYKPFEVSSNVFGFLPEVKSQDPPLLFFSHRL